MPRENNFLLGYGERLTQQVYIKKIGGPKNPPYDFLTARTQVQQWVSSAVEDFSKLPSSACPEDQVTSVVTLHPRYLSKSDFPRQLFETVGLRAVGGRIRKIAPKQWGIKEHPVEAITDEILVMGTRKSIRDWSTQIAGWHEKSSGAAQLVQLEEFRAYDHADKIQKITQPQNEVLLEVVLHESNKSSVIEAFEAFALEQDAKPAMDRIATVRDLAFIPVFTSKDKVKDLANFSYIRVVRAMPTMRPLQPTLIRSNNNIFPVKLPEQIGMDSSIRVVIFDGGLPKDSSLSKWVNLIEPEGISHPVPQFEDHGLAVTSALLFGPLKMNEEATQPLCHVDHVRVLDDKTGSVGDFEYYEVLDRILKVLDEAKRKNQPYEFVNLSLGPDMPVDDTEITRWTASLDELLAGGDMLTTVAAGNSGDSDSISGLNRIQPPSDAVNVLSVGACNTDEQHNNWMRANYSSVGPGRCPGIVKPDGVVFGGCNTNPFMVLGRSKDPFAIGTQGTSFAAPYALRSGVAVKAQLGNEFGSLVIRALLIHRADQGNHSRKEVGWGRFETDYDNLVTCDDDEALVIFKGVLPVKEHLRAPVPLPDGGLQGMIEVTATLVIAPEVDPSFPNAYTRAGLEVVFRPDSSKYTPNKDGSYSAQADTKSFFNQKNIYGISEYELREDGHKWEPCLKATQRFRSTTLNKPCFDIYYHHRAEGVPIANPQPIPYALVVGIRAKKVADFYNRLVRTYANQLVPLTPKTRIRVRS